LAGCLGLVVWRESEAVKSAFYTTSMAGRYAAKFNRRVVFESFMSPFEVPWRMQLHFQSEYMRGHAQVLMCIGMMSLSLPQQTKPNQIGAGERCQTCKRVATPILRLHDIYLTRLSRLFAYDQRSAQRHCSTEASSFKYLPRPVMTLSRIQHDRVQKQRGIVLKSLGPR
jgi:hypothetical protein